MRALLLLLAFLELGEALNVLFYTAVIGTSHVYFLNSAIKALLKNGHTVDVVMSVYNEMVTVKLQEGVRRVYHNRHSDPNHWEKNAHHFSNMFEKKWTSFGQFEHFQVTGYELCKIALKDQKLQDFIQNGNYSIGVTSDYDPCGGILFTASGIASSAKMLAPENDGSLLDRFVNLLRLTHYHYVIAPKWENKYNELINIKYGSNFPDVATIERNLDVVFANSNEILEKQRPLSQKIKYIGGIGVKQAKQLPEEFETLLSRNSKHFVLFSFGTQVPAEKMPKTIRKNFVEAFKTFPNVTFLWKYDNIQLDSELFDGVENVQRLQWLPQAELLR
uniref:glucuronosyltransferase n=1 Tax=Caenorhabditis japonica TaxID=281687 RepID=A0A8R1HG86_CAEJA